MDKNHVEAVCFCLDVTKSQYVALFSESRRLLPRLELRTLPR